MPTPNDSLGIRAGAQWVMSQATYVSLEEPALQAACENFAHRLPVPEWNTRYHFGDGTGRTANYIFVLDALNFCFWGEPRWKIDYEGQTLDGYWALAASLKRAISTGRDITDAHFLQTLDEKKLGEILQGEGEIPLLAERAANAREVGETLLRHYGGQTTNLIEQCHFDAIEIVRTVVAHCASFRDEAAYKGRKVPIYKRAQIFAADLYGVSGGAGWGALRNLDALTCFADYKLPQILRRMGVIRYREELARRIDARTEIPAGSEEEIEIRAATIVAVESMREYLSARGTPLSSVQIDWALWEAAQGAAPDGKPYHRTRTIFY